MISSPDAPLLAGVFRVAVALLGDRPREDLGVTLGRADRQVDLFDDAAGFCERSLPENSIYRFFACERDRTTRVDADFRLLAAAVNYARLAVLGVRGTAHGWATAS